MLKRGRNLCRLTLWIVELRDKGGSLSHRWQLRQCTRCPFCLCPRWNVGIPLFIRICLNRPLFTASSFALLLVVNSPIQSWGDIEQDICLEEFLLELSLSNVHGSVWTLQIPKKGTITSLKWWSLLDCVLYILHWSIDWPMLELTANQIRLVNQEGWGKSCLEKKYFVIKTENDKRRL